MATYKLEEKSKVRLLEWRKIFGEAARMCHEKVKDYPKGKRLQAFRECMRATLKGRGK